MSMVIDHLEAMHTSVVALNRRKTGHAVCVCGGVQTELLKWLEWLLVGEGLVGRIGCGAYLLDLMEVHEELLVGGGKQRGVVGRVEGISVIAITRLCVASYCCKTYLWKD